MPVLNPFVSQGELRRPLLRHAVLAVLGGVGGHERALRDHSFPIASPRFEDAMRQSRSVPLAGRRWGWLDRASPVRKGADDPLGSFPNLKRLFEAVDTRPAVARAREVGKDYAFKRVNDEETNHRFGG